MLVMPGGNQARLGGSQQRPGGPLGGGEERDRGHGQVLAGDSLHADRGTHPALLQPHQWRCGSEEEGEVPTCRLAEGIQGEIHQLISSCLR